MKSNILEKLMFTSDKEKTIKSSMVAIALCFLFVVVISAASGSNFFNTDALGQAKAEFQKKNAQQSQNLFITSINKVQQSFHKELTAKIRDFRKSQDVSIVFALLLTASIYGFLHGIGPGHGKTIIAGWILSQQRTFGEIAIVSAVGSFIHAFSSVFIVFLSYQALGKFIPGAVDKVSHWFQIAAGLLLLVLGLQIVVEYLMKKINQCNRAAEVVTTEHNGALVSTNPWWIAFMIGVVPCPLAAIIFVYCLAGNMLWLGLMMAGAFAAGIGLSIFIIAVTTWLMKLGVLSQKMMHISPAVLSFCSVIGGVLFMAMGYLALIPYIV